MLTISERTNLITLLRHPWDRLQSNFHHYKKVPHSDILSPEINSTHIMEVSNNTYQFSMYPGISNCATKMLNGYFDYYFMYIRICYLYHY